MKTKRKASRRDFLKLGLIAGGVAGAGIGLRSVLSANSNDESGEKMLVLSPDGEILEVDKSHAHHPAQISVTNEEARKGIPGKKFVMLIDLAKCDGCKKCTEACQKMHFTPADREWIKVFKMQDAKLAASYWFPKPCFQCDNPPCTKVCPVDATFKRQDGIVLIDNERCIGCRFCMAACPYSARFFNWERPEQPPEVQNIPYSPEQSYPRRVGTVEKCDFCPDMIRQGRMPACASACPMNAIYFGDQNEDAVTNASGETVRLSQSLEDNSGYRYLEDLGTEPRVYYLPPKNRRYPKPEMKHTVEGGHMLKQKS